jgi:hypothetical protein
MPIPNIYEANRAFYTSHSLETLAQIQSIPIINDINILVSPAWADEPIDEFTEWLTAQRREERA